MKQKQQIPNNQTGETKNHSYHGPICTACEAGDHDGNGICLALMLCKCACHSKGATKP